MNTNLTEQPRPYTHSQLKRLGRVKATRRPPTNATVTIGTVVSSPGKKPRLQTRVIPVEHKGRTKRGVKAYRIETTIVGDVLHGRSLPEAGPAIRLKSAKAAARNAKDDETPLRSYRPEYLDLTCLPATFPRPKTRAPRKKPKYPPPPWPEFVPTRPAPAPDRLELSLEHGGSGRDQQQHGHGRADRSTPRALVQP